MSSRDLPAKESSPSIIPGLSAHKVSYREVVKSFEEPSGKNLLLYGDKRVFRLSLHLAVQAMARGATIAVVDGGNQFEVHTVARLARERRINPEIFLNRIFISRGFTCYQMEQAITNRLPGFLKRIDSNIGMIFGLLDTFYDEQAPTREVRGILKRVMKALEKMKREELSVLLACTEYKVLPRERRNLFKALKEGIDKVYHLTADPGGSPRSVLLQEFPTRHSPGLLRKEVAPDGTNRSHLHEPDRLRNGQLVEVPTRASQGGSEPIR